MQVGPLAQVLVGVAQGHEPTVRWATKALATAGKVAGATLTPAVLHSTLGRHAAQMIRTAIIAETADKHWNLLAENIGKGDTRMFNEPVVILVDAVKNDVPPGTLRIYSKADILRHAPSVRVGPHDPGVKDALLALELAGRGPRDVTLIGIVPYHVGMSPELSQPIRDAIPKAIDALVDTLARYGEPATRRAVRLEVSPWWTPALA